MYIIMEEKVSTKIKVDEQQEMRKESVKDNFIFEKVLQIDNDRKLVYILGRHRNDEIESGIKAILKIERETFNEAMLS